MCCGHLVATYWIFVQNASLFSLLRIPLIGMRGVVPVRSLCLNSRGCTEARAVGLRLDSFLFADVCVAVTSVQRASAR